MKRLFKILLIILLIVSAIFLIINYKQNNTKEDNTKVKENKTEEIKKEEKEKTESKEEEKEETQEPEEYTFEDEYGSGEETKVKAYEYVRLSGFAGAGNHVFYIDENHNLIYLFGSEKKVLSDNIIDLNYNPETDTYVTAYYKDKHNIKEENRYIQYEKK